MAPIFTSGIAIVIAASGGVSAATSSIDLRHSEPEDDSLALERYGQKIGAVISRESEDDMLKEFKEFAMKGSVIDLAIGVVIGAAFGKIIDSFVNDIIMPPIGLLLGRVDFANLFINLSGQEVATVEAARKAGLPVVAYGMFLNTLIGFLIITLVLFFIVRTINRMKREEAPAPAPAEPSAQEKLLTEIRDLLKRT